MPKNGTQIALHLCEGRFILKFYFSFFLSLAVFGTLASAEQRYHLISHKGEKFSLDEKEYRCLHARKTLEEIFSEKADHFNQPFNEIRDAVQAYKKLNCIYSAGFLFADQNQVESYFHYKNKNVIRHPASLR